MSDSALPTPLPPAPTVTRWRVIVFLSAQLSWDRAPPPSLAASSLCVSLSTTDTSDGSPLIFPLLPALPESAPPDNKAQRRSQPPSSVASALSDRENWSSSSTCLLASTSFLQKRLSWTTFQGRIPLVSFRLDLYSPSVYRFWRSLRCPLLCP